MRANTIHVSRNHKSKLATITSDLDKFGEIFSFKLPGNKWRQGTPLGCVFTFALVIVLFIHGYLKASRVFGFGDTKIIESHQESYLNDTFIISSDQGLNFAYGLTAYDENQEIVEDPSYGVVKAKIGTWGLDGKHIIGRPEALTDHPCTKEELGLTGD